MKKIVNKPLSKAPSLRINQSLDKKNQFLIEGKKIDLSIKGG